MISFSTLRSAGIYVVSVFAFAIAFLVVGAALYDPAARGYLMREVFLALGSFSLGIHDVVDSSR